MYVLMWCSVIDANGKLAVGRILIFVLQEVQLAARDKHLSTVAINRTSQRLLLHAGHPATRDPTGECNLASSPQFHQLPLPHGR